jgi:hypothetical protein
MAPPFLTSALVGSGQLHGPAAYPPRRKIHRHPSARKLGGPQNRYGPRAEEKILPLSGLELRTLGHPASRF